MGRNKMNVDFEIYNNMNQAMEGEKKWEFCDFNDPGVGFPSTCAKKEKVSVANQWNSLTQGGQSNYAYYVWKGNNNGKCEEDSENSSKDASEHSSDDDEKGDKY